MAEPLPPNRHFDMTWLRQPTTPEPEPSDYERGRAPQLRPIAAPHAQEPSEADALVEIVGCTCPHEEQSLGTLHGVRMGRGQVRTSTTRGCPVHDACQRYTKGDRAKRPDWSDPYCPIHGTRDCPS